MSAENEAEQSTVHRYGLCIGINYYTREPGHGRLSGCINDAESHKNLLVSKYEYDESNMVLMRDDLSDTDPLYPSRSNIVTQIEKIVETAKSCDPKDMCHITIAYSGHGSSQKDRNGDEKDGRDETILPADYKTNGVIVDDELNLMLIDPLADLPNLRLTIVMDCCHSGTNCDLRVTYRYVSKCRLMNRSEPHYSINENYKKATAKIFMISGCLDDQYSYDAVERGKNTGALSYCLHRVLKKYDYNVSYKKMMKKLRRLLKRKGYNQRPQLTYGNEDADLEEMFMF